MALNSRWTHVGPLRDLIPDPELVGRPRPIQPDPETDAKAEPDAGDDK